MGRKKVDIKQITDERTRMTTFNKRKMGLMKKAYELSVLCQCEVGFMILNQNDRLYQYASSDMDQILLRYASFAEPSESRNNADFDKLMARKELETGKGEDSDEEDGFESPSMRNEESSSANAASSSKAKVSQYAARSNISTASNLSGQGSGPLVVSTVIGQKSARDTKSEKTDESETSTNIKLPSPGYMAKKNANLKLNLGQNQQQQQIQQKPPGFDFGPFTPGSFTASIRTPFLGMFPSPYVMGAQGGYLFSPIQGPGGTQQWPTSIPSNPLDSGLSQQQYHPQQQPILKEQGTVSPEVSVEKTNGKMSERKRADESVRNEETVKRARI